MPVTITPDSLSDTEVIARTLWGEARNQGELGMKAVACVIRNRRDNPGWWGRTLRGVCLARLQFSCWNAFDPQYAAMHAPDMTGRSIELARQIAADIENLPDITNGADHYCTEAVVKQTSWARSNTPVARVGTHVFYKIGPTG